MAQRRHHQSKHSKPRAASPIATREPVPTPERKPPVVYGKPFVLLEDSHKDTFIYSAGQWVRHTRSIKDCRLDCQVKELSQKINGMTRYEICAPIATAT